MRIFKLTKNEYNEMRNNYEGYCLTCGEIGYELEPDARNYTCKECDTTQVFGIEELLMMGQVEIIDK